jgi:hypothetical protein
VNELSSYALHRATISWDGPADADTESFVGDLLQVSNAVHQGMVICGPWMEARLSHLIRDWLPAGWTTSGPSQVYNASCAELRSRSWDIIVHRDGLAGVPPPAAPGSGWPLVPLEAVAAVIDTKTNFSEPAKYAAQRAFNLMNDCERSQLDLLGADVAKIVLTVTSSRSPDALRREGERCGLNVFGLGRYRSGAVSEGVDRKTTWLLSAYADGEFPFQAFKTRVLEAVAAAERAIV